MNDKADDFTLNADGDFYERTVAASDLDLSFDSESDGKYCYFLQSHFFTHELLIILDILLSYSLGVTSSQIELSDSSSIRFFRIF